MRRRAAHPAPEPAGGAAIPGFSEVQEIGGGAFATVYRALEEGTRRPVALKLLKVGGMQAALLESFQAELQALALVSSHPNIVTLYRPLTTPDGRPVLVLELCRESFAERVRTAGPLPVPEALSVGVKIAGALETAHRAGFLHRDMKPQNLLVTGYGEPALADFGVAALQAAAQTTEGVFGFTTLHAPPEVLEGTPLSPATDVYGLASTLYQLLTGRAPFATYEGEAPASVILRILRDPVRPLASASVPLALSDLLGAALSKDPAARPTDAAAFAEALRAVEAGAGLPPTPYLVLGQPTAVAGPAADPTPAPTPAVPPVTPVTPAPAPVVAPPSRTSGLVAPVAGTRRVVVPGAEPPAAPALAPLAPPSTAPPSPAPSPPAPVPLEPPRRLTAPEPAEAGPVIPGPAGPPHPVPPASAPDLGRPVAHLDPPPLRAAPAENPLEQTVVPSLGPAPGAARPDALRRLPADEGRRRPPLGVLLTAGAVVVLVAAAVALYLLGVF